MATQRRVKDTAAALRRLKTIMERLAKDEGVATLPVTVTECEQLRSMVRRASYLPNIYRIEDMLLGDLWGLWNHRFDPTDEVPHPHGYGRFELRMWQKYVSRRKYSLSEMLADHVGNCLSWSFSAAIVFKSVGISDDVRLCLAPGHMWVETRLNGRIRRTDLANRAHGQPPTRKTKVGEIKI